MGLLCNSPEQNERQTLLCGASASRFVCWNVAAADYAGKEYGKLEVVSTSFCEFWVPLLGNSYQATF